MKRSLVVNASSLSLYNSLWLLHSLSVFHVRKYSCSLCQAPLVVILQLLPITSDLRSKKPVISISLPRTRKIDRLFPNAENKVQRSLFEYIPGDRTNAFDESVLRPTSGRIIELIFFFYLRTRDSVARFYLKSSFVSGTVIAIFVCYLITVFVFLPPFIAQNM